MEYWRDELYHHGIKGQRWGVRRYQNKDGTLTAKGEDRQKKAQKRYKFNTPSIGLISGAKNAPANGTRQGAILGSKGLTNAALARQKVENSFTKSANAKSNAAKTASEQYKQSARDKYINRSRYSGKPDKSKVDAFWESHPQLNTEKNRQYLNTVSSYDNLSNVERIVANAEEYEAFNKMSAEDQLAYLEAMRKRQMEAITSEIDKHLSISGNHEDGRYNVVDKIREHITGRLDSDHAKELKNTAYSEIKTQLVANNRWAEKIEASEWARRGVNTTLNTLSSAYNKLLINKAKSFIHKIFG